ncbi:MAG: DUF2934 domain-containing protein [Rhodospirillaceae bacterium]|nr:DUF2934 domain-containing protein [Rhodospirillales bacterium]
MAMSLTLAETGALALADAATDLDQADDTRKFLGALERNRKVWQTLKDVALRQNWRVPNAQLADYALNTAGRMGHGVNDAQVSALIDINRRVSAELAGGCIDHIRERAYFIWENSGRPQGQDLEHWLIAEIQMKGNPG